MIKTHPNGYIQILSEIDIDDFKNDGIARVVQIEKIDSDKYICELVDEEIFHKTITPIKGYKWKKWLKKE